MDQETEQPGAEKAGTQPPPAETRTPIEPEASVEPAINLPPAVACVASVLIGIQLFLVTADAGFADALLRALALETWRVSLAIAALGDGVVTPRLMGTMSTLITHGLVHAGWLHVVANTGMLMAFGSPLERRLGPAGFLFVLLVATSAGGVAFVLAHWGQAIPVVGASGGVAGCLGAVVSRLWWIDGSRQSRSLAVAFVSLILGIELVVNWFLPWVTDGRVTLLAGVAIAWEAHLGGLAAGLILGTLIPGRRFAPPS